MPTGYTAPVCDGKITEFKDFALSCARAFGALITMRDDPADAEIPDEFKPSTYHADELIKAKRRIAEIQAMTPEQAAVAAFKAYQSAVDAANDYNARQDCVNERLDAMLAKVRAWMPPSPDHEEMKSFMIKQLTISKGTYRSAEPANVSVDAWRQAEITEVQRDMAYHAEEQQKENELAAARTAWVKALRASLS